MRQGERTDLVAPSVPVPKVSQAEAAKMLDVSVSSIGNFRAVAEKTPELLPAVMAGDIGIRAAADMARHPENFDDEQPPPEFEAPFDPDDSDDKVVAIAQARPQKTTAEVAEANTQKAAKTDARINNRDIRIVFRQLDEAERDRFLAEVVDDVAVFRWLTTAPDAELRNIADAAFAAIRSDEEKLRHDDVVKAWLENYENGDALE